LGKTYYTIRGETIEALSKLNFEIYEGEFISVVGPSGCGKSTLLSILAGLLPYTAGQVQMKGEPIRGPSEDIGVVFQDPVLLPWRTVLDNTLLPIEVLKRKSEDYSARAMGLLNLVGLQGFEQKYPFELSGGMQQRVAITRALIHDPKILLMDEPFGALDAMTREQLNMDLLRIWAEARKTIFFITHSIPEAILLADRVMVLSHRPGTIHSIINIDLPRPRGLAMVTSPSFGEYNLQIRSVFEMKGDSL
jgi:NitT/TauT family transport system ATP-binding protein